MSTRSAVARGRTALAPVASLERAREREGEPFAVQLQPAGLVTAASHPELVEALLAGPSACRYGGHANASTIPLLGRDSVFLAEGEVHQRRRRVIGDVFAAGTEAVASRGAALLETALPEWPASRPFPLVLRMRPLLLRAHLPLMVQLSDEDRRRRFEAAVLRMLSPVAALSVLAPRPLDRSRWPPARLFAARRRVVRALVVEEVRRRRRQEGGDGDVLGALLREGDDGGTVDENVVAEEVVTVLLAATEVPAVALGWAVERLVRSDTVMARLAAGEHGLAGAVVAETLRVRSPVVGAFRELGTPLAVGGRQLPAGTTVMAAIPLVHRRPDLYPAPDVFRPDRFLGGRLPAAPSWLPFGMGRRRCLGEQLATAVVSAVLERLVGLARLVPGRPGQERQQLLATIVVPSSGCLVRIAERVSG